MSKEALDLYVIFRDRSAKRIAGLLDELIPGRHVAAGGFEVSDNGKEQVLRNDTAVMNYAEKHHSAETVIYYNADHDYVTSGIVCYTSDGYVILGLTVFEDANETAFKKLVSVSSPLLGFMEWECPPPFSHDEFCQHTLESSHMKFTGDRFVDADHPA